MEPKLATTLYSRNNWLKLRVIIKKLVTDYESLKYCDEYRDKFLEIFKREFPPLLQRMKRETPDIDLDWSSSKFIKLHTNK